MPSASSAVAGSSSSHSGRRVNDRRASPTRRRCPCDSARAGKRRLPARARRWPAHRADVRRFRRVVRPARPATRDSLPPSVRPSAPSWWPQNTASCRTRSANGATSSPRQRTRPAAGSAQAGEDPQERRLARAVGAGHQQRVFGLDAEARASEKRRVNPRCAARSIASSMERVGRAGKIIGVRVAVGPAAAGGALNCTGYYSGGRIDPN